MEDLVLDEKDARIASQRSLLTAFWFKVRSEPPPGACAAVTGVGFPSAAGPDGGFYVRPAYVELYDMIASMWSVALTGVPGIGKSTFGWYFLWRFAREPEFGWLAYRMRGTKYFWVFMNGRAELACQERLPPLAKGKKCFAVYDTIDDVEPEVGFSTLLITSPNEKRMRNIAEKSVGPTGSKKAELYMPSWEEKEFNDMVPKMQYKIEAESFEMVGCNPRYAQHPPSTLREKLLGGIGKMSTTTIAELLSGFRVSAEAMSHRLFSVVVGEQFDLHSFEFASRWIGQQMLARLHGLIAVKNWAFVESRGDPAAQALRGIVFEYLAHGILSSGGSFTVRGLYPREAERTTSLGKLRLQEVKGMDVAKAFAEVPQHEYLKPDVPNFPAGDAFVIDGGTLIAFQMTVSEDHEVKFDYVCRIKSVVKAERVVFTFVVPSTVYPTFGGDSGRVTVRTRLRVREEESLLCGSLTLEAALGLLKRDGDGGEEEYESAPEDGVPRAPPKRGTKRFRVQPPAGAKEEKDAGRGDSGRKWRSMRGIPDWLTFNVMEITREHVRGLDNVAALAGGGGE